MPITLGSNINSLRAQRQLAGASAELGSIFERLSSGQRINRASDDAAGLAIADTLRSDARIFTQGIRNLNDGISLYTIADKAIENLSGIVVRLEELAAQSANGVYSNVQRKALDNEAQALSEEFFRISKTTEFNGQKLLTGDNPVVSLQAGRGDDAVLSTTVGGAIGTGQFQDNTTQYGTEFYTSWDVTLGDLNGDGILDLVTSGIDFGDGSINVRLGNGDGSFGSANSLTGGLYYAYSVTLGDLNGDGILDIVSAGRDNSNNGNATVRLGDGTGSFGAVTSFAMEGDSSLDVSLGDLNGDGILDLVTSGYGGVARYATVRLGDGSGSFGESTTFEQDGVSAVSLGDLNGDGILDLVTAGSAGGSGYATIRLGNGQGSFDTATSFTTEGDASSDLALEDLNGDGVLDLITAGRDGSNGYATVRLGDGTGSFDSATSYTADERRSRAVNVGDLNGDGFLDLVTAGSDDPYTGTVTVRLGDGTGTFGAASSYTSDGLDSRSIAIQDLDSDGVLDLVTAGYNDGITGSATVRLSETTAGVAPLLEFSLETIADARQALPVFQRKREQLAEQRGEIGANMARVGVATNVLSVAAENFLAAESRIRDADIAAEAAGLTRLNILQQAASAVLAQANLQPSLALQLLQ